MARTATGLTIRQAEQLLRCQKVREARLVSELASKKVDHASARRQEQEHRVAADKHASNMDAELQAAYGRMVGARFSLGALDTLRSRELAERSTHARLVRAAEEAQSTALEAQARETAARDLLAGAGRAVARRERLLDVVRRGCTRALATRDEARRDDGHAALDAWRR